MDIGIAWGRTRTLLRSSKVEKDRQHRRGVRDRCSVTWAFANGIEEAAKVVRCFGEEACVRALQGAAGESVLWGEWEWLEEEETEGEADLTNVEGMNAFAAYVMLYGRTLEDVLDMSPESRMEEFGGLVGKERVASLAALTNLSAIAAQNRHFSVLKLVAVLRLRVLVAAEIWEMVGDALQAAEQLLLLAFDDSDGAKEGGQESGVKREGSEFLSHSCSITSQEVRDGAATQFRSQTPPHMEPDDKARTEQPPADAKDPQDPVIAALSVHTLMLGIIYHTHGGRARAAEPRLAALHSLMDSGAPVGGVHSDGLVEVPLSPHPPIHLRVSHPRVIFLLTFLISAVAKRDPVGRRPTKKVFAESGIVNYREGCDEDGGRAFEINVPPWSSHGDVENIDQTVLRIEADLLCELAAVSIQRCDFDAAGKHLDTVVAHTRTRGFFSEYAPRITLHYAHLAHAIGDTDRAVQIQVDS